MAELTGLFGVDWVTLFVILFAATLVAMSRRRDVEGSRIAGFLIIPTGLGTFLLIAMVIRFEDDLRRFLPFLRRPVTAGIALVLGFMAVAVADLIYTRFVGIPGHLRRGAGKIRLGDVGLALFIGGAVLLAFAGMVALDARTFILPSGATLAPGLEVAATHGLPSPPLGIALRSDGEGYLSLGTRVAHFELREGARGPLTLTTVADGFSYTRGLTIVGDVLVVADLGQLPCPDPFPFCKGHHVPGGDEVEGERRILTESRARLVAFDVQRDGSLTNERTIVDKLPVVDSEHGVNGLATGPDGFVYVAIGNLDHLPIDVAATVERPNVDLLGTVLRVSPDGEDVEVFAKGLRNVYGLAFDERGGLWGVDNDGETPNGWRAEEILHIRRGADYGFPHDGSFGPQDVRTDLAIWFAQGVGTAGILWSGDVGLGPGLLIGSCGHLDGLRLTDDEGEWRVDSGADYDRLLSLPGCVTDIEPLGEGRVMLSLLQTDALYILEAASLRG
jgi:hypothetical protein